MWKEARGVLGSNRVSYCPFSLVRLCPAEACPPVAWCHPPLPRSSCLVSLGRFLAIVLQPLTVCPLALFPHICQTWLTSGIKIGFILSLLSENFFLFGSSCADHLHGGALEIPGFLTQERLGLNHNLLLGLYGSKLTS